jgi:hypothetical protein
MKNQSDKLEDSFYTVKSIYISARCRWLTPVILAIQEAEIRRITV